MGRFHVALPLPPANRRARRGRRRTAAGAGRAARRSSWRRSWGAHSERRHARCIDRASPSLSSPPPPTGRSMPHHTSLIAILCVGFVLAFVLGMVAQRLRLSPLVGYLVAGIIAGPFTPGFVGAPTLAPRSAEHTSELQSLMRTPEA